MRESLKGFGVELGRRLCDPGRSALPWSVDAPWSRFCVWAVTSKHSLEASPCVRRPRFPWRTYAMEKTEMIKRRLNVEKTVWRNAFSHFGKGQSLSSDVILLFMGP